MKRRHFLLSAAALSSASGAWGSVASDPRDIRHGLVIPDEGYCDQPYIVRTNDGNWLCVLTTGQGLEGQRGQHICAAISKDQGRTWSPLIDIEPASGPEASWAMPLKTPGGRVYVFYTYNRDDLRQVKSNDPRIARRVDTLGVYAFKYSDDHGRTWSRERYEIPMRLMRIDRENTHQGKVLFFWGVGKPTIVGDAAYFGFAKVGKWGSPGTMVESQGCFMRSANILRERDPRRIQWELLPDGDEGLRAPKGPVSDEANLVPLSDGSLYATYRTIDGYSCHAYSRDGGHTWTPPEYAVYRPGGRRIKHPRAANFVRRFSNGKYLLWYHNHGGEPVLARKWEYYRERNPAWVAGGVERNGRIWWSEPEILLYDQDPAVRISYPDFVEENGRYWVSETQKTVARVHEIDRTLLEGLWNQFDCREVARDSLLVDREGSAGHFEMPVLPDLARGGGFSLEFRIRAREWGEGQVVLDARAPDGRGIAVTTSNRFTLQLSMSDGRNEFSWDTDPGTGAGTLRVNAWHHVVFIVDGGPKIVTCVVDGVLNDGGVVRQYGWGRFGPELGDVNGAARARLVPSFNGALRRFRLYGRYLRTSEAVGNYRGDA